MDPAQPSMHSVSDSPAPRQVVLLCDGTNNNLTGGLRDTNVVKLSELLRAHADPSRLVYYDPGVGNAGELPGATPWDKIRRRLERLYGLAFGRGVYENMAECYLFLMRHYRPGDELYIFGFSRGAFTARSVAGLVNQFGILQPHMESMVPTLLHVYFSNRSGAAFQDIAAQIKRQFAAPSAHEVDIHFVGVWDSVASVGLPPFDAKITALPHPNGKHFVHVRQALALDEHRRAFKPRLYAGDNGPFTTMTGRAGSLCQLWFPGAHCDVGGGYEVPSSALSDLAFAWLVKEAVACGLRLNAQGQALNSEDQLRDAMHAAHKVPSSGRLSQRHSELRKTALWALAGMCVRDTNRVVMDDGPSFEVKPEAYPLEPQALERLGNQAADDELATPPMVWIALALVLMIPFAMGQVLHGPPGTGSAWGDVLAALNALPEYLHALWQFQWWQLSGWSSGLVPAEGLGAWSHSMSPRWALVWDMGLIASYAVVLSWFSARAFHRIAGLGRVGDPPRIWLNRLGLSLTLAVLADIAENVLTWFAITLVYNDLGTVGWLFQLAVAVCSIGKWAGLVGVFCLIASGWVHRLRFRSAG